LKPKKHCDVKGAVNVSDYTLVILIVWLYRSFVLCTILWSSCSL